MYNIRHLHPAFNGFKMMLVMPQAVRAKALFIYKIFFIFHMGNFCHPVNGNTEYRASLYIQ